MMGESENVVIRMQGLRKSFGHIQALQGVDLTVREGESWLIFGPNGAGKTTLIGILSLLLKPTAGELIINGTDAGYNETGLRQKIGVISHQTFLYGDLTAFENLVFYGRLYGITDVKSRARSIINEVGLADWTYERVRNFSRGMQQRLAIARALLHRPSILLLDEPYTGLDQHGIKRFQSMLRSFHSEERIIVMTSHNLALGVDMCTHIAILTGGRVVFSSTRADLKGEDFEEIYNRHVERRRG